MGKFPFGIILGAMIKKEFLLVFRDKHALMALFVMPAIFILIMSVAMRDQFSTNNLEFSLYVKDVDKTQMSFDIMKSIQEDTNFIFSHTPNDAQFLVEIPKRYSKNAKKKIKININGSIKSNQIEIFKSLLAKHILNARFDSMSHSVKKYSKKAAKTIAEMDVSVDNLYKVKYNSTKRIPNSTQQSVPAWIVFGMFFIIIPMSTIYINERKQNTLARLNSMNISLISMTFSKMVPYLFINQIQVWIMIGVGIFLVPLFNTPSLVINGSLSAIILMSFSLSIAAIGLSMLIAVSAKSSEQATTIGGISNILLGAIGGVMVPKFIMPESMQSIAELSPMSWGLDGFIDIFLNAGDINMVAEDAFKLLAFGLTVLIISMFVLKFRIDKGL